MKFSLIPGPIPPRQLVVDETTGELVTTPAGRYTGQYGPYRMCAEESAMLAQIERAFPGCRVESTPAGPNLGQAWFEVTR